MKVNKQINIPIKKTICTTYRRMSADRSPGPHSCSWQIEFDPFSRKSLNFFVMCVICVCLRWEGGGKESYFDPSTSTKAAWIASHCTEIFAFIVGGKHFIINLGTEEGRRMMISLYHIIRIRHSRIHKLGDGSLIAWKQSQCSEVQLHLPIIYCIISNTYKKRVI